MDQLIMVWLLLHLAEPQMGLHLDPLCVAKRVVAEGVSGFLPKPGECGWEGERSVATVMGECTSRFGRRQEGRAANIVEAARRLNGTVVPGGGVFSFNQAVGKRTLEGGFHEAGVFVGGGFGKGVGGGVCQVASTLHVAALQAGMEIVERWPHRFIVAYVPEGQDAAVSFGTRDLTFRNPFPFPVTIRTGIGEPGQLKVEMRGPTRFTQTAVSVKRLEEKPATTVKLKRKAHWLTPLEYRGRPALKLEVVVRRRPLWGGRWRNLDKRDDTYRAMPWVINVAEYPAGQTVLKGVSGSEIEELLQGAVPKRFQTPPPIEQPAQAEEESGSKLL